MLKISPPVKCSGKHCEKSLNLESYKGNLCQQCMSRLRRGSVPTENIASATVGVKFKFAVAASGTSSPPHSANEESISAIVGCDMSHCFFEVANYVSTVSKIMQDSKDISASPTRLSVSRPTEPRLNRSQRLSFLIPFRTSKTRRISSSINTTYLHKPPTAHFNSEGEHVAFTTYEPGAKSLPTEGSAMNGTSRDASTNTNYTTAMITPPNVRPLTTLPIRHDVTSPSPNATDNEHIDTRNVELSYPYPELPDVSMENHFLPELYISFSSRPHDFVNNNVPKKRLKVSHPEVIDYISRPRKTSTSEEPEQVALVKASKQNLRTSRSLKLCSTATCTGIVSAESIALRCLACVRRGWKDRISKLSTHNQGTSAQGADGCLEEERVKKGVTWADEMPTSAVSALEKDLKTMSDINSRETVLKSPTTIVSLSRKRSISVSSVQIDCPPVTNCSKTQSIPTQSIPKLRLKISASNDRSLCGRVSTLVVIPGAAGTLAPTQDVSGWDSDLTELSDSTVEQGSHPARKLKPESESQTSRPPSQSSGLKIRIPPRPGGVYIRQCGSHGCNQLLEAEYRWKSCVACRARNRDYQRKRQKLQGRHVRLDQKLQAQKLGLLAGEIQKEKEGADSLVPGARLCSIRSCTFIIPAVEEYRWKMCSLCRLWGKERNKQDKYNSQPFSESLPAVEDGLKERARLIILKALKTLPLRKRNELCPSDRCRSVDCGTLIESKSLQCKQCSARHIWLLTRSGISNVQVPICGRQYTDKPRRSTPYAQFKCFPALLSEFKSRLRDFLYAQSIYFLFKRPSNPNAMFAFDGEFSIVAPDFDLLNRQEGIDAQAQRYKREIEHVGRIKFRSKKLVSILEGGGVAVRFVCQYNVPVLQDIVRDDKSCMGTTTKSMQCELEVANLPDHSHPYIPGQRTIIRFRLLG